MEELSNLSLAKLDVKKTKKNSHNAIFRLHCKKTSCKFILLGLFFRKTI